MSLYILNYVAVTFCFRNSRRERSEPTVHFNQERASVSISASNTSMARQYEKRLTDRPPVPSPRPVSNVNHMYISIKEKPTVEACRATFKSNDARSEIPPPYVGRGYETPMTFVRNNDN